MLNKVMLIGRLCADPDVRYMPSGDPIATMNIATSRRWKDRDSKERKEETEFHRVTFFGALAKIAAEYLKKGAQVYVEGRIKTDKYQNDGVDVYRTGIIGEQLTMLGSKKSDGDSAPQQASAPAQQSGGYDDFDDDIPF